MVVTIGTTTVNKAIRPSRNGLFVTRNGQAILVWYDGTNTVFAVASAPYTSWSVSTTVNSDFFKSAYYDAANDLVYVVTGYGSGGTSSPLTFYKFSRSSGTWSVAAGVVIDLGAFDNNDYSAGQIVVDSRGYIWVMNFKWNGEWDMAAYYSADGGTTFTLSTTYTPKTGGSALINGLALVGPTRSTFMMVTALGGVIGWVRRQLTDGLTTWDAPLTQAPSSDATTSTIWDNWDDRQHGMVDGNGTLVWVWAKGATSDTMLSYSYYQHWLNTWADGGPAIGEAFADSGPALCTIPGSKDLLLIYSKNIAANNFELVYRRWDADGRVWGPRTLITTTTSANRKYPTVAVTPSGQIIFVWQEGTATPWNIQSDVQPFNLITELPTSDFRKKIAVSRATAVGRAITLSTASLVTIIRGFGTKRSAAITDTSASFAARTGAFSRAEAITSAPATTTSRVLSFGRLTSLSVAISTAAARILVGARTAAFSATVASVASIVFEALRSITLTTASVTTGGRVSVTTRLIAISTSVVSAAVGMFGALRSVSSTISVGSQALRSQTLNRVLAFTSSSVTALARMIARLRGESYTAGVTTGAAKAQALTRSLNVIDSPSTAAAKAGNQVRQTLMTAAVTTVAARLQVLGRLLSSSISSGIGTTKASGVNRVAVAAISVLTVASRVLGTIRAFSGPGFVTTSAQRRTITGRTLSAVTGAVSGVNRVYGAARAAASSVAASAVMTRLQTLFRTLVASAGVTTTAVVAKQGLMLVVVTVSNTVATLRALSSKRSATQTTATSTGAAAQLNLLRTVSTALGISILTERVGAILRSSSGVINHTTFVVRQFGSTRLSPLVVASTTAVKRSGALMRALVQSSLVSVSTNGTALQTRSLAVTVASTISTSIHATRLRTIAVAGSARTLASHAGSYSRNAVISTVVLTVSSARLGLLLLPDQILSGVLPTYQLLKTTVGTTGQILFNTLETRQVLRGTLRSLQVLRNVLSSITLLKKD